MYITPSELLDRYAAGERNFAGIKIDPRNNTSEIFRGANLGLVYFRGANLSDANLTYAKLGGADLTYAILEGANLSRVNLSKIDWFEGEKGRLNTMRKLQAANAFIWKTT